MEALRPLLAAALLLGALVALPRATRCDTSYYEKYYSARRFAPPKREAQLLHCNFSVTLDDADAPLAPFERLALAGDAAQLGGWRPERALLLNRTHEPRVWTGTVALRPNTTLLYRYFVAAPDEATRVLHVRRWEAHVAPRRLPLSALPASCRDTFGRQAAAAPRHVQRGWLHAGRVLQLQLLGTPLHLADALNASLAGSGTQLRVELQPVEPRTLTPLLASGRAHVEYARLAQGESELLAQPAFGVPYAHGDALVFHATLGSMERVAYALRVYASAADSELVRLVGYAHVLPASLVGSAGNVSVQLLSPLWQSAVGRVELRYLVLAPLPGGRVDLRTSFAQYWRANWTALDVGHRGLGKSLKLGGGAAPAIAENTLATLQAAAALGADLVEFDVQLTSDLLPVIYHDYAVYVCMHPKTPKSRDDLTQVLIKDVTYEQLKNLKTYQLVGNKIIEYAAHNAVEQEEHRLFPLFADLLLKVNKTLGFDIEIKWPQLLASGGTESVQTIDKNTYVDRILDVMLEHGCGRLSFFTSFDADICTLLRYKQNLYPVMLLVSNKVAHYADPRTDTIAEAINNAKAFDLAGIVPHATYIQKEPAWIERAQRQQLKVFLWGDDLKDADSIAWFKQQGPHGVIYDRLDLWLPFDKQNAFARESDLPEFFQLQCARTGTSDADGAGIAASSAASNNSAEHALSNVNLL